MKKFLVDTHWRSKNREDWFIQTYLERNKSGYVGLNNLGCTCYMVSISIYLFTNYIYIYINKIIELFIVINLYGERILRYHNVC